MQGVQVYTEDELVFGWRKSVQNEHSDVDHRWDNRRLAGNACGAGRRPRRGPRESHCRGYGRARWRMDLLFLRPARRLERRGFHRGCDFSLDPPGADQELGQGPRVTG